MTFVAKSDVAVERSYNCLCSYLVGPMGPLTLTTSLQGPIAIVDLISVYNNDRLDTPGWQVFVYTGFYFSLSTGFIWPQVMDTNRTRVQTAAGEPTDKCSVQKTLLILYIYTFCLTVELLIQTFKKKLSPSPFLLWIVTMTFWTFQEPNFEFDTVVSRSESDLQIRLSREPALMRPHQHKIGRIKTTNTLTLQSPVPAG